MNSEKFAQIIKACSSTFYAEPKGGQDKLILLAVDALVDGLPPGSTVLDVGCGNGGGLRRIKEKGYLAEGITINPSEIEALQGETVWGIDMHELCDGELLKPGHYSAILARHVLEHSPFPLYVLAEFFQLLQPGGRLYVEVPAPGTICRHETNRNHWSVFGALAWGILIERAGFIVQKHGDLPILTGVGPDVYFWYIAIKPCASTTSANPETSSGGVSATPTSSANSVSSAT